VRGFRIVETKIPLLADLKPMPDKPLAEAAAAPPPVPYEDALAEIERLVQAMEAGRMPLEAMLQSYRRATELFAFCRGRLEAVEQQVKVLEDGELKAWSGA
jgi:exodeoxyribonuclease VII small subunit